MGLELEGMADVAAVQAVRAIRAPVDGWPVMIVGIEMLKSAGLNSAKRVVAGDFLQMHRLAGEGRGIIVTENLAILRNLHMGDMVTLPAPTGVLRLPIVGVFRDYANQTGAVYMDLALFRRGWQDDTVDLIHVYLRPGVVPTEAKQRILSRFQGHRRLFVLLNRDVRQYVGNVTDQWFELTYFQLGVAVLVAVLGIVNALTVSILDRKRELGVLRAVGAVHYQIRQTVQLEAAAIGVIGGVLGLAFGAVNLYYQLEAVRRSAIALPLDYEFPGMIALGLFPLMLLVAWISALGPAEAAVRGPLIEALEYE
jgi:putative ABC transport system permease protein